MPGPQRILIAAVVAIGAAAIYEALQVSGLSAQILVLQQSQRQLSDQSTQAAHQRDDTADQLAALQSENQQLRARMASLQDASQQLSEIKSHDSAVAHDPLQASLVNWMGRVNRLKRRLEMSPDQQIPEMQYLTDQDWLNVTHGKLDTDDDFRAALSALRDAAESEFVKMLSSGLDGYSKANNGQFPTDVSQLQPYFPSPVDNSILQRWEVSADPSGKPSITQRAAVDPANDSLMRVYAGGASSTQRGSPYIWQLQRP